MNPQYDKTPYTIAQINFLSEVYSVIHDVWEPYDSDGVALVPSPGLVGTQYTLNIDGICNMTSGPIDLLDHCSILERATGDVVLTGLGLGIGVLFADHNPRITSVTVVECDRRVIVAVWPLLYQALKRISPRLVVADANRWIPDQTYDFAFLDHAASARTSDEIIGLYSMFAKDIVVWRDEYEKVIKTWQ